MRFSLERPDTNLRQHKRTAGGQNSVDYQHANLENTAVF